MAGTHTALAHAVVKDSSPANQSVITEASPVLRVHFNSRIDLSLSTLTLTGPDGNAVKLPLSEASTIDTLVAHPDKLTPGDYKLRWQVLSVDGHITRGDILFTVAPATAK
jgi:methionine-rich copper-binding protein CopC